MAQRVQFRCVIRMGSNRAEAALAWAAGSASSQSQGGLLARNTIRSISLMISQDYSIARLWRVKEYYCQSEFDLSYHIIIPNIFLKGNRKQYV